MKGSYFMPTTVVSRDTILLLRECNAGTKMAIESIDEVIDNVENEELKNILNQCKGRHAEIGNETKNILNEYEDDGREPSAMAKGMSWIKTNFKLTVDSSDKTIADLVTDGCNMGTKSLRRYINEYAAAEDRVKDIAFRLINIEEDTIDGVKKFL